MEQITYEMTVWTLNQKFDKIINCRVVKPPQEVNWFYNTDFFLDKRLWLQYTFEDATKDFLDFRRIHGRDYFMYRDGTKHYIGCLNGTALENVTPSGFTVDENSPKRFAIGRWPKGTKKTSGTVSSPSVGTASSENFLDVPGYSWGYVKFWVWSASWIQAGDYVTFTSGPLKWVTNKIYLYDWSVYIIGTSVRGTIPEVWDTFDIYSDTGTTIIVGHVNGVSMVVLNGHSTAQVFQILNTSSPVFDIVNYDGNIFALLQYKLFYSRSNLDSNTNFYPLDNFNIDDGKALFPTGKSLICFANTNKLFAAASTTNNTIGYVGYDINYSGETFSKNSYIFTDNTIQILQADKQLMKIDLYQSNGTSFEVNATNMMPTTRGLFEDIEWGEFKVCKYDRFISYIWRKNGKSTIFEYDKQFQHWLINTYDIEVYSVYDDFILTENWIATRWGYTDDWVEYKQEVHFALAPLLFLYMPYVIRTLFGLIEERVDLSLNVEIEIGWRVDKKDIKLSNYPFDMTRHDTQNNIWQLLEEQVVERYNGNIVSIQNSLYKTWRYFRFSYNGYKRFCIGPSMMMVEKFRPFVNELVGTK